MDKSQPDQETEQQPEPSDSDSTQLVENPSYRRSKPFVLTDKIRKQIAGAIAEIDLEQIRIWRKMTPAERVQQAASMIDKAERAASIHLREREPELSEWEALWLVRSGAVEQEQLNGRLPGSSDGISIERFIYAIQRLPSDLPVDDPQKWYKTQKDHWLGWLNQYHGRGAYNRQTTQRRDAKYAYNHIVEPKMLLWLIEAAGVDPVAVNAAKQVSAESTIMQQKSAAIRHIVPWETLAQALWNEIQPKK